MNSDHLEQKQATGQAKYVARSFDIHEIYGEDENWVGETGDIELTGRFVSCVNALAGITNPAAIPQVIEAARGIWIEQPYPNANKLNELFSALVALDTPVPETNQASTATEGKPKI